MASLFELLLDTMPFAAAAQAMYKLFGLEVWELSAADARQFITLLPDGAGVHVELPALKEGVEPAEQPLWAWSQSPDKPAEVGSVYCRVRDADHVGHHVADRIAWGLEEPPSAFQEAVRVVFEAGRAVGGANHRNPLPIVIPCHRVIGADGRLAGFGGGVHIKAALLALEQGHVSD